MTRVCTKDNTTRLISENRVCLKHSSMKEKRRSKARWITQLWCLLWDSFPRLQLYFANRSCRQTRLMEDSLGTVYPVILHADRTTHHLILPLTPPSVIHYVRNLVLIALIMSPSDWYAPSKACNSNAITAITPICMTTTGIPLKRNVNDNT